MKILIIGAVAAGAKAAAKSRRLLTDDSEITIYTEDTHVSYSACGIPYFIEGNFDNYEVLLVRSPEEFEASGVHVHLRHKVMKILPKSKQILVKNLETDEAILDNYDKLIIATGACPRMPNIKNNWYKNIFTVRNIEDAINIKNKLETTKRAVVLGGGYIGLEMLEALVKNNIFTTLIERNDTVMSTLDRDMSQCITEQLNLVRENKFELLLSENIVSFEGDEDGITSVIVSSGQQIECDMAIICVGVIPNVELAKDCGIEIGQTGAIKVDQHMETSIKDIYACGDCSENTYIITKTPAWVPLGSTANKEARCAAINACGGYDKFQGILGSAVTRCMKLSISMTGLTEKQAKEFGLDPVSVVVNKYDKVGFMPDAKNITIKLIADRNTGKLIGGQGIGCGDTDKRINTLTTALIAGLTVKEFSQNDLTYSPAFSTTIDPLLNAAQKLNTILDN